MKLNRHFIWSLLILMSFSLANTAVAQEQVSIRETYHANAEEKTVLSVDANRAFIECSSYSGDSILVEIEIISVHKDKSIAANDLKKMKLLNDKIGAKLYFRNYIELNKDEEKPISDIKVFYRIKVPHNIKLNITNYFGKIEVLEMQNTLSITSNYSPIIIHRFEGKLSIETTFGDIDAKKLKGFIKIKSNRSNVFIGELFGELQMNTKLAEVHIDKLKDISGLNIRADKSKLLLMVSKPDDYDYELDLEKTQLAITESIPLKYTKNEKDIIKAHYHTEEQNSLIFIELNIGVLNIKNQEKDETNKY